MYEYYFLFLAGLLWAIFAGIQDVRTTEISNWLNYSLIAVVLSYRAFYSIIENNISFFFYGLAGFFLFVILGYLLYFGRIFGGGDVKLLMGFGGILPFEEVKDFLVMGGLFISLLFLLGLIWTIAYSVKLISKKRKEFFEGFYVKIKSNILFFVILVFLSLFLEIISIGKTLFFQGFTFISFIFLFLIYIYSKTLDDGFMDVFKRPSELIEGDRLKEVIKVNNKALGTSVHGLSKEEIKILKKRGKKVWIKEGMPFGPAFVFALIAFYFLWVKEFFYLI